MVWFSHEQQPILVAAHEGLRSRLQTQSKKTTEISSSDLQAAQWTIDVRVGVHNV